MHAIPSDGELRGMRVVVMGLGRFGGGVGVTRFLAGRGARVLVTDLASEDSLRDSLAALAGCDVRFRLGGHADSDLDGAHLLVVSPAVDRRSNPFYLSAVERGVPWTTEINLCLSRCRARALAVTGSIGKSTTTAMLHAILDSPAGRSAGFPRALLGGNIGQSLLEDADSLVRDDAVVLELSSFQLDAILPVAFRPAVGGLTNVRPHHLDRHGDFESYFDAKLNLFRHQGPGDAAVVGTADPSVQDRVRRLAESRGARFITAVRGQAGDRAAPTRGKSAVAPSNAERASHSAGSPGGRSAHLRLDDGSSEPHGPGDTRSVSPIPCDKKYDLRLPGEHNQDNAHMAVTMAVAAGVDEQAARDALSAFPGLPHRLEYVDTIDGVRYFNDSKSTSAEAVTTALRSFDEPIVLLCGGKDIGAELDRLADADWSAARAVVCFGHAARRLSTLITPVAPASCRVEVAERLDEAVVRARGLAVRGDVVLLSPGCPSYDAFANYEHRGAAFKAAVRQR